MPRFARNPHLLACIQEVPIVFEMEALGWVSSFDPASLLSPLMAIEISEWHWQPQGINKLLSELCWSATHHWLQNSNTALKHW